MRTITKTAVRIPAGDVGLAGDLFLPDPPATGRVAAAAVVTGTWTSVKEQMADRYAAALAERGIAGLSFDFSGFGLSGGEPREVESPARKAEDIRTAVSFLAGHPAVDPGRIGALAVCASAMYASLAAGKDDRLKALALVAPWIHDAGLVEEAYGGKARVAERLRAGGAAAERYRQTGVVDYVPVADASDPDAAMPMEIDFYTNPRRGAVAGWPNRFAVMAWCDWLTLDGVALADRVTAPTLIVHSQDAAIPDGARRFYDRLAGPKDITWTGGTQFDFYDQPATVTTAADLAAAHLRTHLENGQP
jgi:hypothetical protein